MNIEIKHVTKKEPGVHTPQLNYKNSKSVSVSVMLSVGSTIFSIIGYIILLISESEFADGRTIVYGLFFSLFGLLLSTIGCLSMDYKTAQPIKALILFAITISIFLFSLNTSLRSLSILFEIL